MPSLVTRAALADSVEPLIVAKPTVRMPAPCDANPPMIEESLTIKLPPTLGVDHDRDRRCPEDVRGVEVARRRVRLGRARVPRVYVAPFQDPDRNRLQIREGR